MKTLTFDHSRTRASLMALALAATASLVAIHARAGETLTRDNGAPVGDNQNSQTAGPNGGTLLQDSHLIEKLARFDRERIPERVVHARGTGAHGEFVSYGNFADLTKASLFSSKGKKTPVFVRFSSVINQSGSPETLRDPRGFATKFYTDAGNWDLVGNNLPVFFIRDAMKFPDMVHSLKMDPVTNVQDASRYFDFFAHVPESTNMLTFLYSDLGTPATYREMDGNGVHAYKFVNKKGEVRYVKFHWISQQGIKTLTAKQASEIQATDFNHHTRDLYKAIAEKKFPSWELEAQILEVSQLGSFDFNPLDATKEWISVPGLKRVKLGKMTLNKTPENFFQETEMSAFAPSNLVDGIEPSEDRLLQGRLFSYADTQRYRIGVNHEQLPINRPKVDVYSHNQAGAMSFVPQKGGINYQPNGFNGSTSRAGGVYSENSGARLSSMKLDGETQQKMIAKTLNFRQAGETYRSFTDEQKKNLIANFSDDLKGAKNPKVRIQIVAHTFLADADYGTRLAKATGVDLEAVKKVAALIDDTPKK